MINAEANSIDLQELHIELVDYRNPIHARDLVYLLNEYALDPMGGGKPLPGHTKRDLVKALSLIPSAFSLIGYFEDQPVALANCFEGFSTFSCRPLVNIHDFMVQHDHRGRGFSQQLLQRIEAIARARGCCKLTLEVLDGNHKAKRAYERFGFEGYELDPTTGRAMFCQKPLN